MTPGEMQLMREMLREEIQPVREEQVEQGKRIKALEDAKRSHSMRVRAITTEQIPLAKSEARLERKGDNEAIGVAFDRMAAFMNDLAETAARIEVKQSPVTVTLSDGTGRTSERPASLVAAESSVRTENTTNQIQGTTAAIQVAANRSDTQSLDAAKASQRAFVTSLAMGIALGLWQAIQYLITHPP